VHGRLWPLKTRGPAVDIARHALGDPDAGKKGLGSMASTVQGQSQGQVKLKAFWQLFAAFPLKYFMFFVNIFITLLQRRMYVAVLPGHCIR